MFHFVFLQWYEVHSKGIARKLVSRKVERPTDIAMSRVDFSSDGSSRTRRVVTIRQHFQVSSLPPLSSKTNSCYLTSAWRVVFIKKSTRLHWCVLENPQVIKTIKYLSIYLSIYVSIHLSIHPSIHPSIYLSIYLSRLWRVNCVM